MGAEGVKAAPGVSGAPAQLPLFGWSVAPPRARAPRVYLARVGWAWRVCMAGGFTTLGIVGLATPLRRRLVQALLFASSCRRTPRFHGRHAKRP